MGPHGVASPSPQGGGRRTVCLYQIPKLPPEEPPHTTLTGVAMNAPPKYIIALVLNDYSNPGIDIITEIERRGANLTIFRSKDMDAHHGHSH
eukprot:jgi/Tetstr1/423313/TSEL_014011.t1